MNRWVPVGVGAFGIVLACGHPARDFGDDVDAGASSGSGGQVGGAAGSTAGVSGHAGVNAGAGGTGNAGSSNAGTGNDGAGDAGAGNTGLGEAGASGAAGEPPDPCIGKPCNTPPTSDCVSGSSFKTYDSIGSCSAGACSYASHEIPCTCQAHQCTTDPCVGVTCSTPPATGCKDSHTSVTYAANGTCAAGTCNYVATNTGCGNNQACSGLGVCSECKTDASCGSTCIACTSLTPKCKNSGSTSQCVGCLSNADCADPLPVCNLTTNRCAAHPSCVGLDATCGPSQNGDCCASSTVTGGTFNRNDDSRYPATVSDFRLDKYEVTVGRFKNFIAAYSQTMIPAGAGKNPHNASDPGWNTSWNADLDASATALENSVTCNGNVTWQPGKDNLPVFCVDWFEAEAFCIWDGGRLPTAAEGDYVLAGGSSQWLYPWGNDMPGPLDRAIYGDYYPTGTADSATGSVAPVGLIPAGNSKWGQSDIAGNVVEWEQDTDDLFVVPCVNCAIIGTESSHRINRGGDFNHAAALMTSSYYFGDVPTYVSATHGMRCAR